MNEKKKNIFEAKLFPQFTRKKKKVFNDQLVVFATRILKRYKIKAFFS